MKIIAKWEVEDGYVGKSRPQQTEIDTEEYFEDEEWNNLSEDEKMQNIESFIQEDFESKITFAVYDWGI